MEDLSFMLDGEKGRLLVLVSPLDGSEPFKISRVSKALVCAQVPALAQRIKETNLLCGSTGVLDFTHESRAAVVGLLRFLYLRDYLQAADLIDRPSSMLFHLQMYKIGHVYGVPDLMQQAYAHAFREVELSCSNPPMVMDLCDAVRFLYIELPDAEPLYDLIANYCVGCYKYHGLGESEEFRQTVFEAPDFHQLLLRTSLDRGFDSDGASAIINTDVCSHSHHTSHRRDLRDAARFTCYLHNTTVNAGLAPKRSIWREPSEYVLVHRSRFPTGMPTDEELAIRLQKEEDEQDELAGFKAVYGFREGLPLRPKADAETILETGEGSRQGPAGPSRVRFAESEPRRDQEGRYASVDSPVIHLKDWVPPRSWSYAAQSNTVPWDREPMYSRPDTQGTSGPVAQRNEADYDDSDWSDDERVPATSNDEPVQTQGRRLVVTNFSDADAPAADDQPLGGSTATIKADAAGQASAKADMRGPASAEPASSGARIPLDAPPRRLERPTEAACRSDFQQTLQWAHEKDAMEPLSEQMDASWGPDKVHDAHAALQDSCADLILKQLGAKWNSQKPQVGVLSMLLSERQASKSSQEGSAAVASDDDWTQVGHSDNEGDTKPAASPGKRPSSDVTARDAKRARAGEAVKVDVKGKGRAIDAPEDEDEWCMLP